MIWTALAVFLTVRLFNIRSKVFIAITCGIYTANITVIATTATYIHDLDVNMFALFLSVLAVYLWRTYKYGFLGSSVCVLLLLGLYQSYISVTITLVIFYLIFQLLMQENFKTVFLAGIKSVSMLLIGGIAYYIILKIVFLVSNIDAVSSYNTLDNMFSLGFMELVKNVVITYAHTIFKFLLPTTALPKILILIMTVVLAGIAGLIVILKIFGSKIKAKEKVLCLLLIAILPIAMNVAKILSGGMDHDLMRFAIWLAYLFALLIVYKSKEFCDESDQKSLIQAMAKIGKSTTVIILSIIIVSNITLANEVYLKRNLQHDATLAYFSRVVEKMDSIDEYDREKTPVLFVGKPDIFNDEMSGFEVTNSITGAGNYVLGASSSGYYRSYFEYKLHYRIIVAEDDLISAKDPQVVSMPVFPENGSLQIVNGVLVVKLGQ